MKPLDLHSLKLELISLSINQRIINKNDGGSDRSWRDGWDACDVTPQQLADAINYGFAFSVQYKNNCRKSVNFVTARFLAIDSDGGISVADALADPYIKRFGTVFYTTASHGKDGKEKFRVVFMTESAITSGERFALAMRGLAEKMCTDTSIADAARILFGSKGSMPQLLGGYLPDREVKALVKLGRAARQADRRNVLVSENGPDNERLPAFAEAANDTIPPTLVVRLAKGGAAQFGDLPKNTGIYCPFHADNNPSAFVTRNREQQPCIHCKACRKTWHVEGAKRSPAYDFYMFDKIVERAAKDLAAREAAGRPLANKQAVIIKERHLPPLTLQGGVTLVKSPKGTGKTTALIDLVAKAKRKNQTVLLIGHRQTLLRELSQKLGLVCYLDYSPIVIGPDSKKIAHTAPDYFACSVDSLPKKLGSPRRYDIVIVDESEQVFSHITARTVRNAERVMLRLQAYIEQAPALYLFDADLNLVTFNFVMPLRQRYPKQPVRMILNKYVPDSRQCELFASPSQLVVDLIKSARAGKRLFVACNSRTRARLLAKMLQKDVGDQLRVLLVTAEEKVSNQVQEFLEDVPRMILEYDVVVASPAIGTGIDISFPGDGAMIDVVYGFFIGGINTHYDIDQQLGRVRNPKEVKVWVSGRRSHFETDLELIKMDTALTGDSHAAIIDYQNGQPIVDLNHPLLILQATAYCAQRASQNDLKDLFVLHKERNGWKMVSAKNDTTGTKEIAKKAKFYKREIAAEELNGLMIAERIDEATWKAYWDRIADGEAIGPTAGYEKRRFELENFYNSKITRDLIDLDNGGRFREAAVLYEKLRLWDPRTIARSLAWMSSGRVKLGERLAETPLRCVVGAILAAGLITDTGLDSSRIVTKPLLDTFLAFCEEYRITAQRDLGVVLRDDRARDPVRTLNQFLELIGLEMICLGKTRRGGSTTYRYQLDAKRLAMLTEIVKARGRPRSTLPELLDPPRPKRRSGLDAIFQSRPSTSGEGDSSPLF
jgi:hypothetical protein